MWAWPVWLVFAATGRRGELSGYPGRWRREFGKKVFKKNPAELRIQVQKLMTIYLLKLVDGLVRFLRHASIDGS